MHTALVALGSNLGDRRGQLERALDRLGQEPGVRVVRRSGWYETSPVGGPAGQEPFLNGAAILETTLEPPALLEAMGRVETALGRTRDQRWSARTLDLDLLLFDDEVIELAWLRVPHPRMVFRRFVLEPAAEVAPEMRHPVTGWTVAQLLSHLNSAIPYVAIAGPPASGKTRLAQALLERSLGWLIPEPAGLPVLGGPEGIPGAEAGERLTALARLLDLKHWPEVRATAVSDFWFDQLLVEATLTLSPDGLSDFHAQWADARSQVASPKLTLVLDAPSAVLAERWLARANSATPVGDLPPREAVEEWFERSRAALLAYAGGPGLGPMLTLDAADENVMLAEAQAALEAMR